MLWITAITGVLVGAGLVLLALGLRGRRIDDHPECRACRFDLVGLKLAGVSDPEGPPQCPECGADLSAPDATRIGRRRRLPRAILLGATLLVIGIGAGTLFGPSGPGGAWVLRRAPTSWLLFQADLGAPAAARELARRSELGTLNTSQTDRVAELVLARMEDARPVPAGWRALYARVVVGPLTPQQQHRFILAVMTAETEIRPRVHRGAPIPCRTTYDDAGPEGLLASIGMQQGGFGSFSFTIDGQEFHRVGSSASFPVSSHNDFGGGSIGQTIPQDPPLDVGTHDIGVSFHAWVDGVSTIIRHTRTIEVVPEGEPIVELVRDEPIREALLESIQIVHPKVAPTPSPANGARIQVDILAEGLPIPLACEVLWDLGAGETRVGTLVTRPTRHDRQVAMVFIDRGLDPRYPPDDTERVDVILRPSEDVALARETFERMWGGTIVFEDVPIRRVDRVLSFSSSPDEPSSPPSRSRSP